MMAMSLEQGLSRASCTSPDRKAASIDGLAMTTSALRDATALEFDKAGVDETIGGIERTMFFKSMTTFADHRMWQDVYHVPARGLTLYVKFPADIVTEFTVMSFKEK